ncbi:MAG TPA: hypothetical protein VLL97_02400, partial [Acidobacteriota bacterium]|nr:hypothetical protein [Acidobacteriota bacterium]
MTAFYDNAQESMQSGSRPQSPAPDIMRPWTATRVVGKELPRVDAFERVSGKAEFTHDVILPDMVYGAILRCPHAHAMVRNIDTRAAEKMPGVLAVLTGNSAGTDIPWYSGFGTPPQSRL